MLSRKRHIALFISNNFYNGTNPTPKSRTKKLTERGWTCLLPIKFINLIRLNSTCLISTHCWVKDFGHIPTRWSSAGFTHAIEFLLRTFALCSLLHDVFLYRKVPGMKHYFISTQIPKHNWNKSEFKPATLKNAKQQVNSIAFNYNPFQNVLASHNETKPKIVILGPREQFKGLC